MGGGASTANVGVSDKIPEVGELPSPDSKNVSLKRTKSNLGDRDGDGGGSQKGGTRRSSVKGSPSEDEDEFDKNKLMKTPVNPKLTEKTKKLVVESIQHFFFPSNAENVEHVDNGTEMELILKALVRETSSSGSFAMKEGEYGTKLYILESGKVEVTIGGKFIREMGPGSLFGELALIYDAPRSASIMCTSDCVFWVLSRSNYQGILNMTRSHDVTQRLMECPDISNELGYVGRSKLVKSVKVVTYEKDDVIYEQDNIAKNIIVIDKGCAVVSRSDEKGKLKPIVFDQLHIDVPEVGCKDEGTTAETFELKSGFIFGVPIISGHIHKEGKGMWVYDSEKGTVTCPVRVVAKDKMECTVFPISLLQELRESYPPQQHDQDTLRFKDDDENDDSSDDFGVIENLDITQLKLHLVTSQGSRSAHALGVYSNGREYSIKYISKANIVGKSAKVIDTFFKESDMLTTFHSRFVQKMCCVFETPTAIAFATEELGRGDLFSAIYENEKFPASDGCLSSELIKFYTCSLASGLIYLHDRNIAYRDMKPENVLIDGRGYIKLTEFSFAKKIPFYSKDRWGRKVLQVKSKTICGTPEYMAPEFILCTGNDRGVDLWSLGILLFEMIQKITPFALEDDNNVQELFKRITRVKLIASDILYLDSEIDDKMGGSQSARQLIASLLKGNADCRLGYENGRDILDHPFFQDFNVASVQKGTYESPYVPPQTFLNGISVGGDDGKEMDPSSFFDAMTPKEEKRFQEMFKDRQFTQVYK